MPTGTFGEVRLGGRAAAVPSAGSGMFHDREARFGDRGAIPLFPVNPRVMDFVGIPALPGGGHPRKLPAAGFEQAQGDFPARRDLVVIDTARRTPDVEPDDGEIHA